MLIDLLYQRPATTSKMNSDRLWRAWRELRQLPLMLVYFFPSLIAYMSGFRFIHISHPHRIGHLAIEIDAFLKNMVLGQRVPIRAVLLLPRRRFANSCLADYWGDRIRIVSGALPRFFLKPFLNFPYLVLNLPIHGSNAAYFDVCARWSGRPPVLKLHSEHRSIGEAMLENMGVPRDAWIVCVHSREDGYSPHTARHQSYRNSDINSYRLAIDAIIERGGWCIRMGDATMKPLEPVQGAIDYALSEFRSDWMDVYLCASCRFFLGNTSGLFLVSTAFGVPVALANMAPFGAAYAFSPQDISIPKLVSTADGRVLSFAEILASPVSGYDGAQYEAAGMQAVSNTAEEIRDLAVEMLDRLDGRAVYAEQDEKLQALFRRLFQPSHWSHGSSARISRDFLRRHAAMLHEPAVVRGESTGRID